MVKVMTVVGARPQLVKAAALSRPLRQRMREILVDTGQHYDWSMSGVFFKELGIPPPDYQLRVGSGPHGWQTGRMLAGIEEIAVSERPDCVLVFGDTNSTLAGALAAVKLRIPVAHVEAGVRSFDRTMPEEINRVLTDHISDWLFCPTRSAVTNLAREGVTDGVLLTGDVMLDAVEDHRKVAERSSTILTDLGLRPGGYLIVTVHRVENTDYAHRLGAIVDAINRFPVPAVLPLHPRLSSGELSGFAKRIVNPLVQCIEPVGYLDMLNLVANARKVVTDSGGVQREAFVLRVPCITLREVTEWTETVAAGASVLVGADTERILAEVESFDGTFGDRQPPSGHGEPLFGDGTAAGRIADLLAERIASRAPLA
jgi:UDP-N-acetylglucosamine 2-epimerase